MSDVGEMQNVYDVVDVDEYSEVVTNRVNDDWIVDDDGSVSNYKIKTWVLKYAGFNNLLRPE